MRLAALGLLVALTCAAKPFPEAPRSYVYNEGVVSPQDASALGAQLASIEAKTGHQFVVALFQSLDGESLEDYTNRLFDAWKIGDKKLDDGLLYVVFAQDHRWRVEVGYGLEGSITDLEAGEFGRAGVPYFRRGDYAGGVGAVVSGLAARLEGGPDVHPASAPDDSPIDGLAGFIAVLLVWALIQFVASRTIGRRGGGYYGGGWGGGWGSGGGWGGGGGFSGGGGMSGGGGASGGW